MRGKQDLSEIGRKLENEERMEEETNKWGYMPRLKRDREREQLRYIH